MSSKYFFSKPEKHSIIKAEIVTKYFGAWANIIIGHQSKKGQKAPDRIAYLDLYSGPGKYENGTPSTPLKILQLIISNPKYRNWIVTIFNDESKEECDKLKLNIESLEGVDTLRHQPIVWNFQTGDKLISFFEQMKMIPTLCFADPCGYKGLSPRLYNAILKDWGCDILLFFNYNRINMSIPNKLLNNVEDIFGKEKFSEIRQRINKITIPYKRHELILQGFKESLEDIGRYAHSFRFKTPDGSRISHHLVFASKHELALNRFKEIAAKYSSRSDYGVPSFEYNPRDEEYDHIIETPEKFEKLCNMLLKDFKGRTMTMKQIFNKHHIGKDYIEKNYKEALIKLEKDGKIITKPPA